MLPLAHIVVSFMLDGKKYEVDKFDINFSQPTDYKGQPQHEIKGGKLSVRLYQAADDNLYSWAKDPTKLKSGVVLFQTDLGITVLKIIFADAYCINLSRNISSRSGTSTELFISPKEISIDGIEHNNFWPS
jgi:hypothetical protein